MISQYCGDKFSVEPVDVTYDDNSGDVKTTPLLSTRTEKASVAEICSIIGVEVRVNTCFLNPLVVVARLRAPPRPRARERQAGVTKYQR